MDSMGQINDNNTQTVTFEAHENKSRVTHGRPHGQDNQHRSTHGGRQHMVQENNSLLLFCSQNVIFFFILQ